MLLGYRSSSNAIAALTRVLKAAAIVAQCANLISVVAAAIAVLISMTTISREIPIIITIIMVTITI